MLEQGDETGGVETMNGRPWRGELHHVTSSGGQVEVVPVDEPFVRPVTMQTETGEDAGHAHVDTVDVQTSVVASIEDHVGDPRQAMTVEIHDLRVEHVASQEEFVGAEHDHAPVRDGPCRRHPR